MRKWSDIGIREAIHIVYLADKSYAKYQIECQLRQIEPLDRDTYLSLWNETVDAKAHDVVESFSSLFPQKSVL